MTMMTVDLTTTHIMITNKKNTNTYTKTSLENLNKNQTSQH